MGREIIEKEIREILEPFVGQFNNVTTRQNIAIVLERYLNGLLHYRVVCE